MTQFATGDVSKYDAMSAQNGVNSEGGTALGTLISKIESGLAGNATASAAVSSALASYSALASSAVASYSTLASAAVSSDAPSFATSAALSTITTYKLSNVYSGAKSAGWSAFT